jgi:hypothetical protein
MLDIAEYFSPISDIPIEARSIKLSSLKLFFGCTSIFG